MFSLIPKVQITTLLCCKMTACLAVSRSYIINVVVLGLGITEKNKKRAKLNSITINNIMSHFHVVVLTPDELKTLSVIVHTTIMRSY